MNKVEYKIVENKSLIIASYIGKFKVDELIEFKKKLVMIKYIMLILM